MPIYEYVCDSCQAAFEKYVRAWGESVACPSCQSDQVEKQLSTFAFSGTRGAGSGSSCGSCQPGPSCSGCHK